MRPILSSIFNVVLLGTAASAILHFGAVTLALAIVMSSPYLINKNMKIILVLLLLVPFASFGAIVANSPNGATITNLQAANFQPGGTFPALDGQNLTNLPAGGGGDQVWTNDSGVIQPVSTNAIRILPNGQIRIGPSSFSDNGDTSLVVQNDVDAGDSANLDPFFFSASNPTDSSYGEVGLNLQASGGGTLSLVGKSAIAQEAQWDFSWVPASPSLTFSDENGVIFSLDPRSGASSTVLVVDTSVAHSSGNLLEVKNNGTNKFVVAWDGSISGPPNLATNNGNNQFSSAQTVNGGFTNTGYSSTTTNYATKLRVGGAAESSAAVNITGTVLSSGTITSSDGLTATFNVLAGGLIRAGAASPIHWNGNSRMYSPVNGFQAFVADDASSGSRLLLGGGATSALLWQTTNWPSLSPASKTNGLNYAELSVMAGTNTTEFASLKANQVASTNLVTGNTVVLTNGTVAATEGIIWQGGAQLTNVYTATATLDFGNVSTIGCADLTIAVTGAALGDVVDLGVPNASIVANSSYSAWVSAADTVTVRFCALISGDPASGVFRAEVHKWK